MESDEDNRSATSSHADAQSEESDEDTVNSTEIF